MSVSVKQEALPSDHSQDCSEKILLIVTSHRQMIKQHLVLVTE